MEKTQTRTIRTGYVPRKLQAVLHAVLLRFNVIVAHRRFGKCCIKGTQIPTPKGFVNIEDISIGDTVFAHDGSKTKVVQTYSPGVRDIYEVVFDTDEKVYTDEDHIWYVEPELSKVTVRKNREEWKCGNEVTTLNIQKRLNEGENFYIPLAGKVSYSAKKLPIDPFLFGYWLGNGASDNGHLYVCKGDEHILEGFYTIKEDRGGHNRLYIPKIVKHLKQLNVYKNKHIPHVYIYSSVEQRIALLQGMMDSDGTVSSSRTCRFDNKNEKLIDDFLIIARSLGLKATKKLYANRGEYYCLFRKRDFDVFRLKRKNNKAFYSKRPIRRKIREINKLNIKKEVFCLAVDNNKHLYLCTKGYIPTHNTIFTINEMIDKALKNKKKNPQYAYIAPTYREAKRIAWQYFIDYCRNIPGVSFNKTELTVYINRARINEFGQEEPDVIKIMLIGADDPDDVRGIYLDGVILDEFAQCDPILWGQIVRPALSDRKGWAIFIGTPKGKNHFYNRYLKAQEHEKFAMRYRINRDVAQKHVYYEQFEKDFSINESLNEKELQEILDSIPKLERDNYLEYRRFRIASQWYTTLQKASITGVLERSEIEEMTEDLSPAEVDQELECDFAAAILGSYYGKWLKEADKAGRIRKLVYNPNFPVDTFWDIGVSDKTTIWFRQKIGEEYYYIDFIEDNGKGLHEYVTMLDRRPYKYGRHIWPHDGKTKEWGSGETRQETGMKLGLRNLEIQPRQSVQDQIDAARKRICISYFDVDKCARGIQCLDNFQKEYDHKLQKFKDKPKHDWSSHASSSFQYSALDSRTSSFYDVGQQRQNAAIMEYDEFA